MDIRKVPVTDTYLLRRLVLRAGLPLESCQFPEDEIEGAFHLAKFDSKNFIVAVASFSPQTHMSLAQNSVRRPYRLRGMATHPDFQGSGLGSALVEEAFKILRELGCDLLWCHARSSARRFYEKSGFVTCGAEFDTLPIGPHFLMTKSLELIQ